MKSQFRPWQLSLLILAGWINRKQQDAFENLITVNRLLNRQRELAFPLAGRRKPGFRSIDVGQESGAFPTRTIKQMRN